MAQKSWPNELKMMWPGLLNMPKDMKKLFALAAILGMFVLGVNQQVYAQNDDEATEITTPDDNGTEEATEETSDDVIEATADNIPLGNESCEVIMFDPPFVISGEGIDNSKDGSGIISKRFTAFTSFEQIKEMYSGALNEFARVLKQNGIVIFKCQDVVACGKNHFTHCWTMNEAVRLGFYPKDMFILFAKNRINDGRKQQHGRKYHCYYWVFEKRKCRVDYSSSTK